MPGELPADVRTSLLALLDRGADAARERDERTVEGVVDSVETLAHHEVSDDEIRMMLLHGCRRANETMIAEPLVTAEYLEAMARLIADE
ncbi:hypothetical protein C499_04294 [Halogeometricum borinquense DSM 11551]|uniref:DUF8101 domain-containing protein n=2 Tax=Halogeometricum borinquense TaxID=60847 RepID=E4NSG0_HALBP|nr:hypothetical protein [Halogeometricum borinquense]ADQ66949.1 hypothetical protein Hbor_13680 [Halogeometricum borinquense DSM 11551]ELY30084.1 hypothetical protein C499_04294 [Halogeometricum borinquense DSM 11551]RYJ14078.1 hypothetical protein ELS19_08920 [Halogeometricum borinquense]